MHKAIVFETDLFNGTSPRPEAVNELIGGDETANWIHSELSKRGYEPDEIVPEDHGWDFLVGKDDKTYLIVCSCDFTGLGQVETCHVIQVSNRRSLIDKLLGRNKTIGEDPMYVEIRDIVRNHPKMAITEEVTME
jgi:hypothetical protein